MVMAALYELLPDKLKFRKKMEQLGLHDVTIEYTESVKCGITGTHISVKINGVEEKSYDEHHRNHEHDDAQEHEHSLRHRGRRYGYTEILEMIQGLDLPEGVKADAIEVYKIIGTAEANVHGTALDDIHFHEVGSIDAVVDVVGCSLLMSMLEVTDIIASPVCVGFGMVRCEHGVLPVPAPATSEILKNIPMYSGRIEGELCTPTGAALIKHFSAEFGEMPLMSVKKIGYGMGTKDFEAANCLRAFLYDGVHGNKPEHGEKQDEIYEISCNLDDMTPEAIGAAFDILLENGALDVFTTPIMMKKNRPAVKLSCLCNEDSLEEAAKLMIVHTTTLGVRTTKYNRLIMERSTKMVKTIYGDIRVKIAEGFRITKQKPEYEDVLAASKKHNVPYQTVYDAVFETFGQ